MTGETTRSRNPAGHAGLLSNLLALIGALAVFFESRAALLAKESKTALIQLLAIATCAVAAVMLFACGYVFLLVSAVVMIGRATQVSWVWIALAAAGLHFLCALILLLMARAKMTRPLFRATVEELKRDREWLENLDETTSS
jgi:uncharacterized membrane protein YqjE